MSANGSVVLEKAKIGRVKDKKFIHVLFNPSEYSLERSVNFASHQVLGLDSPVMQFAYGESETLRMNLFFDTYSTGVEGGDRKTGKELEKTSAQPEAKKIDVRKYTDEIYKLMAVDGDQHAPPAVFFEWGKFRFEGYLISVSQTFTKFTYKGVPVRARLDVTFKRSIDPKKQLKSTPRNSPDRTKFRSILEGDTLTAIAEAEYSDPELWREIARANDIENPRLLATGAILKIPALP